ncbi:DUF1778 domain-containing protein [Streptomyces sp. MBT65]|uniref:type II toxin-antitoxin system TacA family antitoxin n=1 Tax=Streptomyces sp. MBT65 TaxID=1488395 RepID=UPI00190BB814|nr:DUF1778 domain-containing protein [Streptomyces sp. MBT65]MBK3581471.1 DUF1778 domain-containing protein [Streptomyces sp. MBT65]
MRTARFEFRLDPDVKERIETAAELVEESASDFARRAAVERAGEVLRAHQATVVPSSYFSELLAALDQPVERNETLTRAAERARDLIKRK